MTGIFTSKIKTAYNTVYNLLLVLAYLRKSSRTFLVGNYLLNYLLETRNKPYTSTCYPQAENPPHILALSVFADTQIQRFKTKRAKIFPTLENYIFKYLLK